MSEISKKKMREKIWRIWLFIQRNYKQSTFDEQRGLFEFWVCKWEDTEFLLRSRLGD